MPTPTGPAAPSGPPAASDVPPAATSGQPQPVAPPGTGAPVAHPGGQPVPQPWRPPAPLLPPRPPGPVGSAVSAFWRDGRRPLPLTTLGLCLVAGVLGAVLTVGSLPGLGLAVTAALLWAAAVPFLVRRRAFGDLATAALAVALVSVAAVRAADWVVAIALVTALGVAAVAATSARSAPAVLASAGTWTAGAVRAVPWLRSGLGDAVGTRRQQVAAGVRSLAVTAVLLLVFGLLFASADEVFASYLPRLDLGLLPARVVVAVLLAFVALTTAHLALAPPGWSAVRLRPARPAGRGEWLLPVTALAALVLAFVLVQVGALLGGHRHVLETTGLTYAEYARQGFAQLVAATALTLLVVAVAARKAPRGSARDVLVSKVALAVLCVGTLGVVASALRRIDLYVDAYGLTRTRLLVVAVELALGVILLLVLAAGARWQGRWLPVAVVQVTALTVLGLALVNPDAQILRHNTTAELSVPLDVSYLAGLSVDALPAAADLDDDEVRTCVVEAHRSGSQQQDPSPAGWNLGRWRGEQVLDDTEHGVPGPGCESSRYWD